MANSTAHLNGKSQTSSIKQLAAEESSLAGVGRGSNGAALVLTADQRIEDIAGQRATRGPLVGLTHLFDALSGQVKRRPVAVLDTAAVETLQDVWSDSSAEDYYEDESAVGLPSQRQEQRLQDAHDGSAVSAEHSGQLDPDGVVASFMAEKDLEADDQDDADKSVKAGQDVQFRHRGWSYDLMSAAGWQKGPNTPDGPLLDYREVEKQLAQQEAAKNGGTPVQAPTDDQITRLNPVKQNRARTKAPQVEPVAVDRDVLREIVAEVLREELSGEMGERVTRNVRKLVRREITRAIQADEID